MSWLMATSGFRRAADEVIALYWESGVADDVPALAWFLLSSLAPLALGLTALASVLLGDYAQAQAPPPGSPRSSQLMSTIRWCS